MDQFKMILMLVVAFILWRLYHRLFTVVYTNAVAGILREIVICFVISFLIVTGIFSLLKPKEPAPEYLGNYYNLSYLDGNGLDVSLMLEESESIDSGIKISGFGYINGVNYKQTFVVDIEKPQGNTIVCYNELHSSTLTITFHPDTHTLDVIQETTDPDVLTLYTGTYVDSNAWENLREERLSASQAAQAAREPNYWIDEYFGSYVLASFAEGEEDAPSFCFTIRDRDRQYFIFENHNSIQWYYPEQEFVTYEVPYPSMNDTPGHIEYKSNNGLIAFDVLDDTEDGLHRIQLTDFPYPNQLGIYISGAELIDSGLSVGGKRLKWDGVYTCYSGGEDGIKTISVTQMDDTTLSVDMTHTYANGRVDTFYAVAEIGTYSNGPYFASYDQDKRIYFTLEENPDTNEKMITITQVGIMPSVDREFGGVYVRS